MMETALVIVVFIAISVWVSRDPLAGMYDRYGRCTECKGHVHAPECSRGERLK